MYARTPRGSAATSGVDHVERFGEGWRDVVCSYIQLRDGGAITTRTGRARYLDAQGVVQTVGSERSQKGAAKRAAVFLSFAWYNVTAALLAFRACCAVGRAGS